MLNIGTLLISRRHGVKCILLGPIEELAFRPQHMSKLEMSDLEALLKPNGKSIPTPMKVPRSKKKFQPKR
jgi:hypothetical protein